MICKYTPSAISWYISIAIFLSYNSFANIFCLFSSAVLHAVLVLFNAASVQGEARRRARSRVGFLSWNRLESYGVLFYYSFHLISFNFF